MHSVQNASQLKCTAYVQWKESKHYTHLLGSCLLRNFRASLPKVTVSWKRKAYAYPVVTVPSGIVPWKSCLTHARECLYFVTYLRWDFVVQLDTCRQRLRAFSLDTRIITGLQGSQFSSVHKFLNSLHTIYNHITKLAIQIINETT